MSTEIVAPESVSVNVKKTIDDLKAPIEKIAEDLKGKEVEISDLMRHVPELAAFVQKFEIAGAEKKALVMDASLKLVELVVKEDLREPTRALVSAIFPAAIENVIDVARGRVSFEKAVEAVVASAAPAIAKGCLPFLVRFLNACLTR